MTRIVLIDDEALLLKSLTRLLEAAGYEVCSSTRVSDVDERLHPGRFDVLITDILMPESSGLDVLERVMERGCREPVILFTGEPNVASASEAVRLGAFDYLSKPVGKDRLLDVAARAARHVKLLRERDAAESREQSLLRNLATIGESAAMLAHEVKTPLSNLNLALRAVADQLETDQRTVLEELVAKLRNLERLMRDTLAFAKPLEVGHGVQELGELVGPIVEQFAQRPESRRLGLEFVPPEVAVRRRAAPRLVEQMLNNLMDNAAAVIGDSGHIRVAFEGDRTLAVEDDGPGIPEDQRERVFEPFHSMRDGGTGLGLPICRKVADAHGWTLTIDTSELGGARFSIDLGLEEQ